MCVGGGWGMTWKDKESGERGTVSSCAFFGSFCPSNHTQPVTQPLPRSCLGPASVLLSSRHLCKAVNVVSNAGADAGQMVFHTHFHVIPRFKGDNLIKHPVSASHHGNSTPHPTPTLLPHQPHPQPHTQKKKKDTKARRTPVHLSACLMQPG